MNKTQQVLIESTGGFPERVLLRKIVESVEDHYGKGKGIKNIKFNILKNDENPLNRRINWLHEDRNKLIVLLELLEEAGLISLKIGARKDKCFGAFIHYNFLQAGRELDMVKIRTAQRSTEYELERESIAIELQKDLMLAAGRLARKVLKKR